MLNKALESGVGNTGMYYEFGDCRLDPRRRLLTREGSTVPLTPKIFDTLLALIQNSGRIVGKDELLRVVWPEGSVEEGNLTQNIYVLRKLLGEYVDDHRYIVTIPKAGYQFVAPVRTIAAPPPPQARPVLVAAPDAQPVGSSIFHQSPREMLPAQLCVKAHYFWQQRTESGLRKALLYAQEAARLDPEYAPAYTNIAAAYIMLAEYLYLAPEASFPLAEQALTVALDIDPACVDAHGLLGDVQFFYHWDAAAAEASYLRALAIEPTHTQTRVWYSWLLQAVGRHDEALAQAEAAWRRDSTSIAVNANLATRFFYMRRYADAVRQCHETLEMAPDSYFAMYVLGAAYAQLGAFDDAIATFRKFVPKEFVSQSLGIMGWVYAKMGNRKHALRIAQYLQEIARRETTSAINVATVYAGLGEEQATLSWLEKAYHQRSPWMVFLQNDPFFEGVCDEVRFRAIIERTGILGRARNAS